LYAKMWQWRFINKYKKLLDKTAQMLRKMEWKRWLQLSDRNRQEIQVLL
jgi:transcription initiation factor TFIIIB Brf1 subunit/transcription initiation factor TFIIB